MTDGNRSEERLAEPRADRPAIPDGYGVPRSLEGVLPWSWARQRLQRSLGYWLVSRRADGHPHAIPTWGWWIDERFYCEGSPETTYGRNIARDGRVVVHLESVDDVVIVDGTAVLRDELDPTVRRALRAEIGKYREKGYRPDPTEWPGPMWEVTPVTARGWARLDEATRWHFTDRHLSGG